MAKRPAQGVNNPKRMNPNVQFGSYGRGAKAHAKPSDAGMVQNGGTAPSVKRGSGNNMGSRPPRDGVTVTTLS